MCVLFYIGAYQIRLDCSMISSPSLNFSYFQAKLEAGRALALNCQRPQDGNHGEPSKPCWDFMLGYNLIYPAW